MFYRKIFILISLLLPLAAVLHSGEDAASLIQKYENNPLHWPALHYAMHMQDKEASLVVLEISPEQAMQKTPSFKIFSSHDGSDAAGDWDELRGIEEGISSIELAVKMNDMELLKKLIFLGVNPLEARKEYDGQMRDWWQTKKTYIKEQCKILKHSFGTDNYQVFTPLYWAIQHNNLEMVELLILVGCDYDDIYQRKHGLSFETLQWKKYSALELAISLDQEEMSLFLSSF